MCGICGYINLDESNKPNEAILRGMAETLRLRGPDDEGFFVKDNACLGHRRLSIIDLESGHQPMLNEDGTIAVVCNGEIYNFQDIKAALVEKGHRFRTRSDTEIIAHAYEEHGEDCLKDFNGMFAIALWDSRKKTLFLARDRFGKKPLYYAVFDNQFIFGSELKAILKHPSVRREIDLDALARYLAYEYVPSPYSIFRNIRKLEPATMLILKGGSVSTKRYWDLDFERNPDFDLECAKERLVMLLKESVRKRLISDVPLGVFLSGGIDSSAVVCMMRELMPPKDIKTFSIGFRDRSFDESSDARLVAKHFSTDHHEEIVEPDTMQKVLPDILNLLDEPFADSSIIPTYIVSRYTRKYVKVALGGDGGDELFLGYPSFQAHNITRYLDTLPDFLKKAPLKVLVGITPTSYDYMSLNFKARRFLRGLDFPEGPRHQAWIGSFTPEDLKKILLPDKAASIEKSDIYETTKRFYGMASALSHLDKASYIYVNTYMTDDILAKVDRASMANSLEVRAPFLDTEFARFAASIPHNYKLRNFRTKWILKEALKGKLPEETLRKKKQGFAVPVAKWLKGDLKGLLEDAFNRNKIKREGIFKYDYIHDLVGAFAGNRHDTRKEIWALFMFEMWYDKWMK